MKILMAVLLQFSLAQSTPHAPQSLGESVLLAINLNPKTKSKDIQVEALHENALAVRAGKYPSGSINCSREYERTTENIVGYPAAIRSNVKLDDCNLTASVTLYDGGANKFAYEAALDQEESVRDSFNSTNPFIRNTKGAIANETMSAYLRLIGAIVGLNEGESYLKTLDVISSIATTTDEQGLVAAKIRGVKMGLAKSKGQYTQALSDFQNAVTVLPGANPEDFETTIQSLKIPASAAEAVATSLRKNPDIQATNASLRAADDSLRAARAALGPHISLIAEIDSNSSHDGLNMGSDFTEHSSMVGVQMTVPLSLGLVHSARAQKYSVDAAEMERNAALDDAKHGIESTYSQLDTEMIQHDLAVQAYTQARAVFLANVDKIKNHGANLPSVQTCLLQFDDMNLQLNNMVGSQANIVGYKFTIQQLAGTVFDQARISH